MWGCLCLLTTVLLAVWGAPRTHSACPDVCNCLVVGDNRIEAKCRSLLFNNLHYDVEHIVSLDLSGRNLERLPRNINKFINLEKLDISYNSIANLENLSQFSSLIAIDAKGNRIEDVSVSDLPASLIYLDLSSNQISQIPDIAKRRTLKGISLYNNPITCDCKSLKYNRDSTLIINGYCNFPETVKGKSISDVFCMQGVMLVDDFALNDEPGSGDGDITSNDFEREASALDMNLENETIDEELIPPPRSFKPPTTEESEVHESSGDRDEGSGDYDTTEAGVITPAVNEHISFATSTDVPNCVFNCSTPDPSHKDLGEPLSEPVVNETVPIKTNFNAVDVGRTFAKEEIVPSVHSPVDSVPTEDVSSKKENPVEKVKKKSDKLEDIPPKSDQTTSNASKSSGVTTYVVVGILALIIAILIVYTVYRKKSNRSSGGGNTNTTLPETELIDFNEENKKLFQPHDIKVAESSPGPEVPLLNDHSQEQKEIDEVDTVSGNGKLRMGNNNNDDEDTEVQPKDEDALPTLETKRVYVKETETPSPKTPLLIHRKDDGTIVPTQK